MNNNEKLKRYLNTYLTIIKRNQLIIRNRRKEET